MTIRNFFGDLWLTVKYGKWRVERYRKYESGEWIWQYVAGNKRKDDCIYCLSKRIAEGVCAIENDLRAEPPDGDFRLP